MEKPQLIKDSFPYREYVYKDNKIVEYASNDFVGFYYNADGEIESVKGKTIDEVCKELDKYAKFMDIADENWQ